MTDGADITRTRITFAINEVRLKLPAADDGVDRYQAIEFARRLEVLLREFDVTLRGRFYPVGGGLRVSLFNGRSQWVAHYHIGPDMTVTEEFA